MICLNPKQQNKAWKKQLGWLGYFKDLNDFQLLLNQKGQKLKPSHPLYAMNTFQPLAPINQFQIIKDEKTGMDWLIAFDKTQSYFKVRHLNPQSKATREDSERFVSDYLQPIVSKLMTKYPDLIFHFNYTSDGCFIHLNKKGINKSSPLSTLIRELEDAENVEVQDLVVLGDSGNDLEMLATKDVLGRPVTSCRVGRHPFLDEKFKQTGFEHPRFVHTDTFAEALDNARTGRHQPFYAK